MAQIELTEGDNELPRKLAAILRKGTRHPDYFTLDGLQSEVWPVSRRLFDILEAAITERIPGIKLDRTKPRESPVKKGRQVLDSLSAALINMDPTLYLGVGIGMDDREEKLSHRLTWGVSTWGGNERIEEIRKIVEMLGLKAENEKIMVFKSPLFGGSTFHLGNDLSPDELENQPLAQLVDQIVNDFDTLFRRFKSQEEEIIDIPAPPHYWKISPGGRAKYWNEFKELSCIAIGWEETGDLRKFNSQKEIEDFITRNKWGWRLPYTSEQLWWLSYEMQTGDAMFAYGGKRILGVGKIVGGYEFRQDSAMPYFAHRRPVDWIYLESKPIGNLLNELQGKLTKTETIIRLSEQEGQQIMALYKPDEPTMILTPEHDRQDESLSKYFTAHGLHFTPEQLVTFYTALKTKGFVILTGISGTGKTKLAQYFAELLGSKDQFHFAAVRPDWRDSKSLLGYFNPLLGQEGQFQSTEFLGFILKATEQYRGSGDSKREDLLALVEKLIEFDSPLPRADLPEEARELVQRQPGIQRISQEAFAEILDLTAVADRFDLSQVTQTFLLRLHEVSPYADEPRKQYHFRMGIPGSRQLSGPLSKGEKVAFVYYSPDRGLWAAGTFDRIERESIASPHVPYFVLLDEMNLAKVEYYFADFLSVLESGRDDDGFTKEAIRFQYPEGIDGPPRQLRLPPNLYFIGTVNVDETTYMFSPKVLDRAFTLELSEVDFAAYPSEQGADLSQEELEALRDQLLPDFTNQGQFAIVDKDAVADFVQQYPTYREHLTKLNVLLQPHDLHFGYRIFDEIMMFLANAEGSPVFDGFGPDGLNAAFDTAVLMKVLPKFHGTRGKLRLPLLNVFAWAMTPDVGYELQRQVGELEKEISGSEEKGETRLDLIGKLRESPGAARIRGETFTYPRTALKALRMLHDLYTTGFASFA